ncbi:MAG: sigma-70 family RNA polymerase sigma factor [Planctomycetes bacterium]|nr:sigma-70 family RNA polymerase sigma factor [Planctomycetota bacterium]
MRDPKQWTNDESGEGYVESQPEQRLSQVQTLWTIVCQAHGGGTATTVRSAQEQLLDRYLAVVRRYLLGALRDADAAEDLTQEFSLRFLRGELKGADRQRGRFRDYLKGTLFHLIGDFHRRRKRTPLPLAEGYEPAAETDDVSAQDQQFLESWRAELLSRAWQTLAELQAETRRPFHQVLQFRAANLELRSADMAEQLGPVLGHSVNAAWVRQTLHRAREKFAEFLLEEVRQTLDEPTFEQLEDELVLLGLHSYCQPALETRRTT